MLLPEILLHSAPFAVLAAFVAINTVMYGALAVGKLLPKVYLSDWLPQRNHRSESRSIYPDAVSISVVPTQSTRTTTAGGRAAPVDGSSDDRLDPVG